jgi:response regulator RpfG family c-di-GMP phosphodiesterase
VTDMDRLKGYQHGAVDHVSVPVVPELLRAKVKVFAELHRKTKQLETLNAQITMLQDEERRRIARELQLLAVVKVALLRTNEMRRHANAPSRGHRSS